MKELPPCLRNRDPLERSDYDLSNEARSFDPRVLIKAKARLDRIVARSRAWNVLFNRGVFTVEVFKEVNLKNRMRGEI